jgi:restriction system protein
MSDLPKFYETFIPILKVLSDGQIISSNALQNKVYENYYASLPSELLALRTKKGSPLILNRIGWGKFCLKKAKMIEQPARAVVKITEKGKAALARGVLTFQDLKKDPDFLIFEKNKKDNLAMEDREYSTSKDSPQDLIDAGFSVIESQVKADLLERLQDINPYYFEKVILILLKKMGYGDFETTPKSGDGGIDGIINEDKLGLEKIYIQAKRYNENKVREKDVRNFIGAMSGDTTKGIFVTTSSFDDAAIKKAHEAHHKIILIDGDKLVSLMHEYGVGVQVSSVYELKKIDEDFFEAG